MLILSIFLIYNLTTDHEVGLLDDLADERTKVSPLEFTLLSLSVLTAAISPALFDARVVEVLAPAAAACK